MSREDIIRMAWKAGFERLGHTNNDWVCYPEDIERFATLVASAEREACAMAADKHMKECEGKNFGVGRAIRAIGDKHD